MRINLKVPFAQKDAAKELGARWDSARKIWYVVDPECIDVFSDWMPDAAMDTPVALASRPAPSKQAGVVTGAAGFKALCHCATPPWEHCVHSQAR